ncbi:MFS transporter [Dethiothermospora halolimnae]|uniref:MFS transporter n=1 Tax=Dethiothermospora halolimnae TaxID=3114390 RepID=UPI003CCC1314
MRKLYRNYIGLFYFGFFAIGSMGPLLSNYLESIGLNGKEIGIITSMTSFIGIFAQPMWGLLCDKTQQTKKIVGTIIIATIVISLFIPFIKYFYLLIIIFGFLYLFQSGIGPIIETMALGSQIDFGKIRQWGAIGFAMAVLISGAIADKFGLHLIFIILAIAYVIALLFLKPIDIKKQPKINIKLSDVKKLFHNKRYVIFLLSTFFISGTIAGHNNYFGLLYKALGGTISGIGLAFLLFAGSEAPFMNLTHRFIKKWGLENILIFSAVISMTRWFWYGTSPSPTIILFLFFLQGVSIGTYLISAAQFIRENTREELRATAMTIYGALSMGLGGMVCKLFGGYVLDYMGISYVYSFFGIFSLIGLICLVIVKKIRYK